MSGTFEEVASKSGNNANDGVDVEDALDQLEKQVDRVKVLYEQYFMGIQKQAPSHMHTDVERKIRDLTQLQIRNTAHRYRFTSLQQKFSSYNSYWRRTMREIEQGRYLRNLSRIGRQASRKGEVIPDEILAAMPARMRDRVLRDRELALAQAQRAGQLDASRSNAAADAPHDAAAPPRVAARAPAQGYLLDAIELDQDFDAIFSSLQDDAPTPPPSVANVRPATPPATPPPRSTPPPTPGKSVATPPIGAATPPLTPPRGTTAQPLATRTAPTPARAAVNDKPPVGMTAADVKTLYAAYLKAKEQVGEKPDPGTYTKLMKTIHQQAPKIMDQYKAKGVEFGVTIKDNQVILKAKPK